MASSCLSDHDHDLDLDQPEPRVRDAVTLLQALWGDELPPAAEPWRTALHDAVTADDTAGTERGVVVQADGLTHVALAALVRSAGRDAPSLPLALLQILREAGPVPDTAPAAVWDSCAGLGMWEYDLATGTVMFDEACGELLGEGAVAIGGRPIAEALVRSMHPEDRARVAGALLAADASRPGFEVAFRALQPDGSYLALRSRGRVIAPVSGPARLVGVLCREIAAASAASAA